MRTLVHGFYWHRGELQHKQFPAIELDGGVLTRVIISSKDGHSRTVVVKTRHLDAGGCLKEMPNGHLVWFSRESRAPTHFKDPNRKAPHRA